MFDNFDEAIICKSNKGISFCNNIGFHILQTIETIRRTQPNCQVSQVDQGQGYLPASLMKNTFLYGMLDKKEKQQRMLEK